MMDNGKALFACVGDEVNTASEPKPESKHALLPFGLPSKGRAGRSSCAHPPHAARVPRAPAPLCGPPCPGRLPKAGSSASVIVGVPLDKGAGGALVSARNFGPSPVQPY